MMCCGSVGRGVDLNLGIVTTCHYEHPAQLYLLRQLIESIQLRIPRDAYRYLLVIDDCSAGDPENEGISAMIYKAPLPVTLTLATVMVLAVAFTFNEVSVWRERRKRREQLGSPIPRAETSATTSSRFIPTSSRGGLSWQPEDMSVNERQEG